ncbi:MULTISPECIES: hypothetical protein [unclassified Pseudomonas]|uniref:hypothetical protein n=1 Tax=unclassified Pseudomonas TaxID=196821 RepID=UPI0014727391|nr:MULTISPECIES: hypothetical protein [unclassified Pseudomonas]NMX94020.1 hypothetical protein [Pseudomonas sp. WS 5086]NMY48934.1 hypothetical protein [Pseudomonas sp. WS 5027]
MRWLVVNYKNFNTLPQWKRTVGISADGSVFVPAAIGGVEKTVSISTLRDQVPVRIRADHVYVPMVWLAENYPTSLDECWIMGDAALKWCSRREKHATDNKKRHKAALVKQSPPSETLRA